MTLPPPQDTLRECAREDKHCLSYLPALSPVYFVTFVLVAQFVLVNVVVAVLMKHLEESNKEAREDAEMDAEIELEMAQGSAAQPPSAAQVRLLRGPRRVPGFLGGAAEPDKQLSAPQESPGTQPDSPNLLVVRKVSVSRMLSLPNDSYMFRPVAPAIVPHPHPLQEVEMETYAGSAPSGMDLWQGRRETGLGGEVGQVGNRTPCRGGVGAKSSGHTVQMHPYPRPSHLCSLTAPGAPCLLPGPISCILPSQGQRSPSCPFTSRYTPLSEPLSDPLQTGKGNFRPIPQACGAP